MFAHRFNEINALNNELTKDEEEITSKVKAYRRQLTNEKDIINRGKALRNQKDHLQRLLRDELFELAQEIWATPLPPDKAPYCVLFNCYYPYPRLAQLEPGSKPITDIFPIMDASDIFYMTPYRTKKHPFPVDLQTWEPWFIEHMPLLEERHILDLWDRIADNVHYRNRMSLPEWQTILDLDLPLKYGDWWVRCVHEDERSRYAVWCSVQWYVGDDMWVFFDQCVQTFCDNPESLTNGEHITKVDGKAGWIARNSTMACWPPMYQYGGPREAGQWIHIDQEILDDIVRTMQEPDFLKDLQHIAEHMQTL